MIFKVSASVSAKKNWYRTTQQRKQNQGKEIYIKGQNSSVLRKIRKQIITTTTVCKH